MKWLPRAALFALVLVAGCHKAPDQTYSVFFQEWSAQLDAPAQTLVKAAATYAMDNPNAPIAVVGYADPVGSTEANQDLSEARATVVKDALVVYGVPATRITTRGHGEKKPIWTNQESRRAEIQVGGGGLVPSLPSVVK